MSFPIIRPRRNRKSESLRALVRETELTVNDLIIPVFVLDGTNVKEEIPSMPGYYRYSLDLLVEKLKEIVDLGINAVALFPCIEESIKDSNASESSNPSGLIPRSISEIKKQIPSLTVVTDVALDPYSSDGHDGIVVNGVIENDSSLEVLAKMAKVQCEAGADFIAPSDMMDGRVGHIRRVLDTSGYSDVGIISYAVKYASVFYGPFRGALDSAPKFGDKKTYQLDPANRREATRETLLDIEEGSDIIMVKPALSYLDIISDVAYNSVVPVAAYNVSGEYSMIKIAAQNNLMDYDQAIMEVLISIKRAGADIIFTYFAEDIARLLN